MPDLAKTSPKTDLAVLEKQMLALDEIADTCGLRMIDKKGRFAASLAMAQGVQKLRTAMTQQLVEQALMPLMNTPLGFLTDKNPKTAKPGQTVTPYGWEVVRDAVIEGVIRGFRPVGNEINIIAARCYGAKAGFERVVGEFPGLTDLVMSPGVPALVKNGEGALVPYQAAWRINGTKCRLDRLDKTASGGPDERIPVRVNFGMGADAIIGKATRKMLALLYGQLTGSKVSVPDGEVEDREFAQAREVKVETIKLEDIKAGDPATYPEHDAPAKPTVPPTESPVPERTAETLRADIKKLAKVLDPGQSDMLVEEAGVLEGIQKCADVALLANCLRLFEEAVTNKEQEAGL